MSKGNNLQSLFCGILFCISVTALIIACLAFTKKGGGKGEYYEGTSDDPVSLKCLVAAAQYAGVAAHKAGQEDGVWFTFEDALDPATGGAVPECMP